MMEQTRPTTSEGWFNLWHTQYSHCKTITAVAKILAPRFGMSTEACRKALSRSNTIENRMRFSHTLLETQQIDPSVTRQLNIVEQSEMLFADHQRYLSNQNRESVGIFLSDKHNPMYRKDVWDLVCTVLEDMPQIDYISALNDWSDMKGWSLRWDDTRPASERLWTEDIQYSDNMELNDYALLRLIAPEAKLVGLMGNHDMWRHKKYRSAMLPGAERAIADYMEDFFEAGVWQFTRGRVENVLYLSPGLVWLHGIKAAKTALSNARNSVHLFTKDGLAPSVVYGHTHRGSITHGHQLGLRGIKAINSPCLCKTVGVDYLKLGFSNEWTHGFTVCYFKPDRRYVRIVMVEFDEVGETLQASLDGKTYSVPLNKD